MIKVAVNGARGRMGKSVIEVLSEFPEVELLRAYGDPNSQELGSEITATGIRLQDSTAINDDFDVWVDFSTIESVLSALPVCCAGHKPVVIGVTGFSAQQHAQIESAASSIPIVFAPNMSLGINLCFRLAEQATAALGGVADIDIIDMHHRHKVDAPSGTALKMGNVIANQLGLSLDEAAVYDTHKMPIPRTKNKLCFQTIRAGDTVGEHTVVFTLDGERVEITHRVLSRFAFARGAVRAVQWIQGKPAGLYDMEAVLGL